MSAIRILVVDDEPEILRCLRPALNACGYDVLSAATGREALYAMASRAPDVVLLDLGLPDMDGKEVITQAGAFSKTPIIVLSARGLADYILEMKRNPEQLRRVGQLNRNYVQQNSGATAKIIQQLAASGLFSN